MNSPLTFSNPFREYKINTISDFRADWDVPSLNARLTEALDAAARRVRGRTDPDPGQHIICVLSPPGYGKSHLFGRLSYRLGHDVFFVFATQIEDPRQPLRHIRWHAVESLFRPLPGEPTIIQRILAELCRPSFTGYCDAFPPSLEARFQGFLERLKIDPSAIYEITNGVRELKPFLDLAESIAHLFPNLPFQVVKVFAMGWSPVAHIARAWLRGDSLPESDLNKLGLDAEEESPSATQVLRTIACLFRNQRPIILCLDQIEAVLVDVEEGARRLANELMGLLAAVPNLQILISCLDSEWNAFIQPTHKAFKDRVKPAKLETLRPEQAMELVAGRIRSFPEANPTLGKVWPFDDNSLRSVVRDNNVGPRGLINLCRDAFEKWVEGDRRNLIILKVHAGGGDNLNDLFLQEWNRELETIRRDPENSAVDRQEERLNRALKEVLILARDAQREMAGILVRNVQEDVIPSTPKAKRYSFKIDITIDGSPNIILAPLTKLANASQFRFFFDALIKSMVDSITGALLVHPIAEPQMGPATKTAFDAAIASGRLRVFSLEEQSETAQRLECLIRFLDRAQGKELQLGGLQLARGDCQDLILKTGVLDNLEFYRELGGWRRPPVNQSPKTTAEPGPKQAPIELVAAGVQLAKTSVSPLTPVVDVSAAPVAMAVSAPISDASGWADAKLGELEKKLRLWGLPVTPDGVEIGPTFVRLRARPAGSRTTYKKVCDKAIDLKIHLGLVEKPLIGSQAGYISVDVQRPDHQLVPLATAFNQLPRDLNGKLAFPVGQDVAGKTHWLNLSEPADCHLLVAGTTGSGKSQFLKTVIASLSCRLGPDQVQFVLIDPKRVTFNFGQQESPYLSDPVAYTVEDAQPLIERCLAETEARYELMRRRGAEDVSQLKGADARPRVVVIIDEFADLMADKVAKKVLENTLKRIGAKARAAGVHLILATQRPEAPGVITTQLRSNLPGRICLKVASDGDSKIMLGVPDAAHLLGKGDLLWMSGGSMIRLQSPLVGKEELNGDLRLS